MGEHGRHDRPRVAVETRPTSAKGTGSLRLKVLDSPLAAVEAALDGGIGVRCAERPTTFDSRQLSRIKLMSRPASGPAQPQGGTPSEPIVFRDATKSASRKVNELREQPHHPTTPNAESGAERDRAHGDGCDGRMLCYGGPRLGVDLDAVQSVANSVVPTAYRLSGSVTASHHLVPVMSLSRSNITDVIRQPSLLRTSSTTAPARARASVAWITLNAMSDVTTTDGRFASMPSC